MAAPGEGRGPRLGVAQAPEDAAERLRWVVEAAGEKDEGGTGRGMVGGGEDMEAKEVKVGNLEEDRMSLDKGPT